MTAATRSLDFSDASGRTRLRRFRVPILVVALAALMVSTRLLNMAVTGHPLAALVVGLATAAAALAAYTWLSKTVEQRGSVPELALRGMLPALGRGMALGFAAFTVMMLTIAAFGGWQRVTWGSVGGLLAAAGAMASVAVNEELLFRGVILRILEERTGTWIALPVSAAIFGAVHLGSPGGTVWGITAIAVEGGLLLGVAYLVTRSLWLPIGLHLAWNLSGAGIYGASADGAETLFTGLLDITLAGPALLTGGATGPEAGLPAVVVCLLLTGLLLRRAVRSGRIRRRR